MSVERRSTGGIDWLWLLALVCLTAAGLAAIYSATEGTSLSGYFQRQAVYALAALALLLVVLYFDYHLYSDLVVFGYFAGIVLLVLVLFFGKTIHSTKSWLSLGFLGFQPSEFMKVIVIVALARYYASVDRERLGLAHLLTGGGIVLVPMLLVVLQGDLGTAMTYVPLYAALSFLGGLRRKHVLVLALAAVVALPAGWMMLRDYQRGRIQTVLDPSRDPHNLGYQTIQSKIAVGSGMFLGKGFKQGSQGQFGFLPARHTDFIFAVLAEEWGFVGSIAVLGLFTVVSFQMLRAAREAKERLGTMIVAGVLALFLFHVFINVGMAVGLLPIAGIPLPLMSAGGSALLAFYAGMGLCLNIRMRRYVN